ncbi:MAG: RDD family protein [Formosimonas sp.]|jgi:uncharacterized RDD family membrane protein YckC
MHSPTIARRFVASIYEFVLLFGLYFVTGLLVQSVGTMTGHTTPNWLTQILLYLIFGLYFKYCWTRSGQTLAQKTWHIRILNHNNSTLPSARQSWLRYTFAALIGCAPALLIVYTAMNRLHEFTYSGVTVFFGLLFCLVLNWLALLGTALLHRERRALHEVFSGTRSVFGKGFD